MSLKEFWQHTPYEINIIVESRAEHEIETQKVLSWLTAALVRTKEFPTFKEYMSKKEKQSVDIEQEREQLKREFGGVMNG